MSHCMSDRIPSMLILQKYEGTKYPQNTTRLSNKAYIYQVELNDYIFATCAFCQCHAHVVDFREPYAHCY